MKLARNVLLDRKNNFSRGLIGVWACNELTGSVVFDYSEFKNDINFNGSPAWISSSQGSSIYLDGSSQLDVASSFVLPTEAFSILIRMMPLQLGSYESIWSAEDGASDRHSLIYKDNSDYFHISLGDGVNIVDATFGNVVQQDEWVDIGLSWNYLDGDLKGYKNGVEEVSSTFNNILKASLSNIISVGNRSISPYYPLTGNISFIYVWNRKLERDEFRYLHTDPNYIFDIRTTETALLSQGRGSGVGILEADDSIIDGEGDRISIGDGDLESDDFTIDEETDKIIHGEGELVTTSKIVGLGDRVIIGIGHLKGESKITGSCQRYIEGIGILKASDCKITSGGRELGITNSIIVVGDNWKAIVVGNSFNYNPIKIIKD